MTENKELRNLIFTKPMPNGDVYYYEEQFLQDKLTGIEQSVNLRLLGVCKDGSAEVISVCPLHGMPQGCKLHVVQDQQANIVDLIPYQDQVAPEVIAAAYAAADTEKRERKHAELEGTTSSIAPYRWSYYDRGQEIDFVPHEISLNQADNNDYYALTADDYTGTGSESIFNVTANVSSSLVTTRDKNVIVRPRRKINSVWNPQKRTRAFDQDLEHLTGQNHSAYATINAAPSEEIAGEEIDAEAQRKFARPEYDYPDTICVNAQASVNPAFAGLRATTSAYAATYSNTNAKTRAKGIGTGTGTGTGTGASASTIAGTTLSPAHIDSYYQGAADNGANSFTNLSSIYAPKLGDHNATINFTSAGDYNSTKPNQGSATARRGFNIKPPRPYISAEEAAARAAAATPVPDTRLTYDSSAYARTLPQNRERNSFKDFSTPKDRDSSSFIAAPRLITAPQRAHIAPRSAEYNPYSKNTRVMASGDRASTRAIAASRIAARAKGTYVPTSGESMGFNPSTNTITTYHQYPESAAVNAAVSAATGAATGAATSAPVSGATVISSHGHVLGDGSRTQAQALAQAMAPDRANTVSSHSGAPAPVSAKTRAQAKAYLDYMNALQQAQTAGAAVGMEVIGQNMVPVESPTVLGHLHLPNIHTRMYENPGYIPSNSAIAFADEHAPYHQAFSHSTSISRYAYGAEFAEQEEKEVQSALEYQQRARRLAQEKARRAQEQAQAQAKLQEQARAQQERATIVTTSAPDNYGFSKVEPATTQPWWRDQAVTEISAQEAFAEDSFTQMRQGAFIGTPEELLPEEEPETVPPPKYSPYPRRNVLSEQSSAATIVTAPAPEVSAAPVESEVPEVHEVVVKPAGEPLSIHAASAATFADENESYYTSSYAEEGEGSEFVDQYEEAVAEESRIDAESLAHVAAAAAVAADLKADVIAVEEPTSAEPEGVINVEEDAVPTYATTTEANLTPEPEAAATDTAAAASASTIEEEAEDDLRDSDSAFIQTDYTAVSRSPLQQPKVDRSFADFVTANGDKPQLSTVDLDDHTKIIDPTVPTSSDMGEAVALSTSDRTTISSTSPDFVADYEGHTGAYASNQTPEHATTITTFRAPQYTTQRDEEAALDFSDFKTADGSVVDTDYRVPVTSQKQLQAQRAAEQAAQQEQVQAQEQAQEQAQTYTVEHNVAPAADTEAAAAEVAATAAKSEMTVVAPAPAPAQSQAPEAAPEPEVVAASVMAEQASVAAPQDNVEAVADTATQSYDPTEQLFKSLLHAAHSEAMVAHNTAECARELQRLKSAGAYTEEPVDEDLDEDDQDESSALAAAATVLASDNITEPQPEPQPEPESVVEQVAEPTPAPAPAPEPAPVPVTAQPPEVEDATTTPEPTEPVEPVVAESVAAPESVAPAPEAAPESAEVAVADKAPTAATATVSETPVAPSVEAAVSAADSTAPEEVAAEQVAPVAESAPTTAATITASADGSTENKPLTKSQLKRAKRKAKARARAAAAAAAAAETTAASGSEAPAPTAPESATATTAAPAASTAPAETSSTAPAPTQAPAPQDMIPQALAQAKANVSAAERLDQQQADAEYLSGIAYSAPDSAAAERAQDLRRDTDESMEASLNLVLEVSAENTADTSLGDLARQSTISEADAAQSVAEAISRYTQDVHGDTNTQDIEVKADENTKIFRSVEADPEVKPETEPKTEIETETTATAPELQAEPVAPSATPAPAPASEQAPAAPESEAKTEAKAEAKAETLVKADAPAAVQAEPQTEPAPASASITAPTSAPEAKEAVTEEVAPAPVPTTEQAPTQAPTQEAPVAPQAEAKREAKREAQGAVRTASAPVNVAKTGIIATAKSAHHAPALEEHVGFMNEQTVVVRAEYSHQSLDELSATIRGKSENHPLIYNSFSVISPAYHSQNAQTEAIVVGSQKQAQASAQTADATDAATAATTTATDTAEAKTAAPDAKADEQVAPVPVQTPEPAPEPAPASAPETNAAPAAAISTESKTESSVSETPATTTTIEASKAKVQADTATTVTAATAATTAPEAAQAESEVVALVENPATSSSAAKTTAKAEEEAATTGASPAKDVIFATPKRFVDGSDESGASMILDDQGNTSALSPAEAAAEAKAKAKAEAEADAATRAVQAAVADVVDNNVVADDEEALSGSNTASGDATRAYIQASTRSNHSAESKTMSNGNKSLASLAAELIDDFDDPFADSFDESLDASEAAPRPSIKRGGASAKHDGE